MLLEKIQKENDIKQLKPEELEKLAEEDDLGCGTSVLHTQDPDRTARRI